MLLSPARRVDTYWPKGLRQLATPPSSCLHSKTLMLTDLTGPGGGVGAPDYFWKMAIIAFSEGGGSYCNQHFLTCMWGQQFFTCTRTPLQPAHPSSPDHGTAMFHLDTSPPQIFWTTPEFRTPSDYIRVHLLRRLCAPLPHTPQVRGAAGSIGRPPCGSPQGCCRPWSGPPHACAAKPAHVSPPTSFSAT